MKTIHIALFLAAFLLPSICRATYDPTVGRWISRDPLGEGASLNLYGYVHNDPANRIDPLGLDDVTFVNQITLRIPALLMPLTTTKITPTEFSIIAHSLLVNPNLIVGPDGKIMDANDLANYLKDPAHGYKPGNTISLHVCNSAVSQNGKPSLAQQLANLMNTQVSGATNETEPGVVNGRSWRGFILLQPPTPIPGSGFYHVDDGGKYVPFQPANSK